jgi:hypothetical protein
VQYLAKESMTMQMKELLSHYEHNKRLIDQMMGIISRYPGMQSLIDDYQMYKQLNS